MWHSSNAHRRTLSFLTLGVAGSIVLPITGAAAADPDPDAQCAKLFADIKAECAERNNAQAELKSLGPPAVPPNLETEKRRKDLEEKIKKLEKSPFLAWCGGWDLELRARSGGDYFHPRDTVNGFDPNPVFSFDWGAASILGGNVTASTEKQRMAFGVGLEGRHTEKSPSSDLAPTNFIKLNAMVIVPVVSGGDLGLSFSIPLMDSEIPQGTIIAASTGLGLLDGAGSK